MLNILKKKNPEEGYLGWDTYQRIIANKDNIRFISQTASESLRNLSLKETDKFGLFKKKAENPDNSQEQILTVLEEEIIRKNICPECERDFSDCECVFEEEEEELVGLTQHTCHTCGGEFDWNHMAHCCNGDAYGPCECDWSEICCECESNADEEEEEEEETPQPGKFYQLTGDSNDNCISNGNSWKESELPTKEEFESYEAVRISGVTNMFNTKKVSELSGLSKDIIINVMENYEKLSNLYPDVKK